MRLTGYLESYHSRQASAQEDRLATAQHDALQGSALTLASLLPIHEMKAGHLRAIQSYAWQREQSVLFWQQSKVEWVDLPK